MTGRLRGELEGCAVEVYLAQEYAGAGVVNGTVRVAHSLGLLVTSPDGQEAAFVPWSAVGLVRRSKCLTI